MTTYIGTGLKVSIGPETTRPEGMTEPEWLIEQAKRAAVAAWLRPLLDPQAVFQDQLAKDETDE